MLIHDQWLTISLDDWRLGKSTIVTLMTTRSGEVIWTDLSELANTVRIFVPHVTAHKRNFPHKKEFWQTRLLPIK